MPAVNGVRMLEDWFDERFLEAGARSFHVSIVRTPMAFVVWAVLGLGADWKTAGIWLATVLLVEWPLRESTRPMARGLPLSRAEAFICMAIYFVATLAWSAAGAILWTQNHVASQLAAAAFFAGHLLYIEAQHGRSTGALIPALPALVAPALAPLIVAHYHGADQVLVEVTMLAVVGHAMVSTGLNFTEARRLKSVPAAPAKARDEAA